MKISAAHQLQKRVLPVIVLAQFACTSLWFAGNAVMNDLAKAFDLPGAALGNLTSAVQLGFIAGTLVFALLTIADRFSPSRVFLVSALLGASFNLGTIWEGNGYTSLLLFRFATGFFLAGIYPVGMKIAADHFDRGLGKSLGFLVGALVLGTAFPHFLKEFSAGFPWRAVLIFTSAIASLGGIAMLFLVPDGPFRKPGQKPDLTAIFKVFQNKSFRAAAFGYFGHMWELYAFWAFVPILLGGFQRFHATGDFSISLWSFLIIGGGSLACVAGGYISMRRGTRRTALGALGLSGLCCVLSPLVFGLGIAPLWIAFLLFWGAVVIADSPLFSTLVAQNAPSESKGSALTIVNCIGFAITIGSIQLLGFLNDEFGPQYIFTVLAIGPLLGVSALLFGKKAT